MRQTGPNPLAPATLSDGAITLPPDEARRAPRGPDAAITRPMAATRDDASRTSPRMARLPSDSDPDDTQPRIELPLTAPMSDPVIPSCRAQQAPTSWARGLAARIDAQLDDDFGSETPVVAPTARRAAGAARRRRPMRRASNRSTRSSGCTARRAIAPPSRARARIRRGARRYPTAEVDDDDIEAAIELAPPARSAHAIGVAKKKPTE